MLPILQFEPILKRLRWGGRRLETVLGKSLGPGDDYAESWEICDHGDDQSRVAAGPLAGQSLQELMQQHGPELLGYGKADQFPLLVKFLDCHDRLSVQVHPNDEQACQYNPAENGKTEAWVILQAEPESRLYAGFQAGVTPSDVARAAAAGTISGLLNEIVPCTGDCFYIPAGTVHALGEGLLVAEIQQSSDLTFRLHDWGRVDREGNARPLHVPEALACLDFSRPQVAAVEPQILAASLHSIRELLVESPYFRIERISLQARQVLESSDRCRILLGIRGAGTLVSEAELRPLGLGETCLIPAKFESLELIPQDSGGWTLLVAEVR